MTALRKVSAEDSISQLNLESSNRSLFDIWLSLWQGDTLPPRSELKPLRLRSFLPNLIVFDVVPDDSVTIRLAGTRFAQILGAELTGKDWLAFAPPAYRAQRLAIFSTVARGAVAMAHRRIKMALGEDYISQEILLPFAASPGSDVQSVLVHINWQPEQFLKIKSVEQVTGDPIDFKLVPLN